MKTARRAVSRRILPLPLFFALALLLFFAGLLAGWAGAAVSAPDSQKEPGGFSPAPAQSAPSLPSPALIPSDGPFREEDWALLLVNGANPLPEGFAVPGFTRLRNGHAIDRRAYPALQRMMDDCRAAGLSPLICSSYRSEETQRTLFQREVDSWLTQGCSQSEAEDKAARWVARPGASEHQTGLAVDIVDTDYQVLDEGQENTAVQRWLMAHCAEYGFILRYPTEKSALTGVNYEPWHYRYVGEGAAREIMAGGLCLEEYLGQ